MSAERALRRVIEESIPAGIAIADPAGRQSYVNPVFCRMVGWPEEALLGASPPFVYWPPEEAEAIRRAFDVTLRGHAPPGGFELRFQRRNGERFDALVVISEWRDGGRSAGWVASVWDISERKATLRRLAAEHEVARVLGRAGSLPEGAREVLRSLCDNLGWDAGVLWCLSRGADHLRPIEVWSRPEVRLDEFARLTRDAVLDRGEGCPGRVLATAETVWVRDLFAEGLPRYRAAAAAGLNHAFAFPILLGTEVLGVAELFSRTRRQPVRDETQTALAIGAQIGQFIERKQAEEALRHSEERYRAIVETANEGAWLIDREGRTLYVNERMAEMLGYTAQAMVGRAVLDFCVPEERAAARERLEANLRGLREQFDFRFRRRDGAPLLTLACTSPMRDPQGNITGALGMFSDVTERTSTEETVRKLAAIVESSEDAIIGKTLDGVVQTWNSGAERVYGYSSAEAIGQSMTFLLPPERAEEESDILARLRRGERIDHYDTVRVRKDGKPIHVSITISPIRDRYGRITGASHVARDITERTLFQEHVRETAKLESLGVLAGGVAHDFNNLLVGIMGSASLALQVLPPDSPARRLIDAVLRASEQAANLTRQLLAYSGKGKLEVRTIGLSSLIRDIVALIQSSMARTITLQVDLDDQLPPIDADVAQIQQLVMNLVINGAEAIGDGPGTVSIRTGLVHVREPVANPAGEELAPGKYVSLEVRDTGCGMDEATQARIFDPFFTTKFTGRGLGLAAALGIVRGHRGSIRVESGPARGSRFTVLFPASQNQITPEAVQPSGELSGRGTVLVVDDEEVVRRIARAALERYGYRVLLAADGREAAKVFARSAAEIAVVLLDLTMPLMSGQETLVELRRIRPDVPVILSSGFNETEAVRRFEGQGLAGFLQKPYTAERLAEKVKMVAAATGLAANRLQ